MNHVIIGTAGHVDHGKSSLIRALTGLETDRLVEERKRGITIELGFAWLDLEDGTRAGIVDVPGHERFIRHMLAGAGGMDLALLVVAADEGVMPQTIEHLGILSLLEIRSGIVVVTKTDLVEEEWLALVDEQLDELCAGTFLEKAPRHYVSSQTGDGLSSLKEEIGRLVATSEAERTNVPFRLPVDRVFTLEGFGTVVTGTLIEGTLRAGGEVMLYPGAIRVRVRGLEVHGARVQAAYAGQRVAVNLSGVEREAIERGDLLAAPDSVVQTNRLDVRLRLLPEAEFSIKNNSRLHFHHGARELLAKVRLLDTEEVLPGEEVYARFYLEEETAVKAGDHFIVRFFSPLATLGGGVILDPAPFGRLRRQDDHVSELSGIDGADTEARVLYAIEHAEIFEKLAAAKLRSGVEEGTFMEALKGLVEQGDVVQLDDKVFLGRQRLSRLRQETEKILASHHRLEPLQVGMRREELRTRLLPQADIGLTDRLLNQFVQEGRLREEKARLALADFQVTIDAGTAALMQAIEAEYREAGFTPPDTSELVSARKKQGDIPRILANMIDSGILVRLDEQILLHHDALDQARDMVRQTLDSQGQLTLAELRDQLGTSRKFAVAILERFDRQKLTRLVDGVRLPGSAHGA